jgi:hypothetical protein
MTTIVQYVPKWLRVRLQKPTQPKPKTLSKKDRQILPIVPKPETPPCRYPETIRPGERFLWRV